MSSLSLSALIQKCTTITSLKKAHRLHALILTTTTSTRYAQCPYLNNNVLSMYARCGSLFDAQNLFDRMPQRNLVSYNSLISSSSRDSEYAVLCFKLFTEMGSQDLRPDGSTFVSLLQACCSLGNRFTGSSIHSQVVKSGFFNDVCVQTSLLGMYSKCLDLESADKVFGCVVEKDVVMWNSMISGNLKNEKLEEGVCLFGEMVRSGIVPTEFSYSMVLNACGQLGYYGYGQVIHARVIVLNVLADLPLQNALLDMYCSCGDTRAGLNVFHKIENPNLISWNTMISGFGETGEQEDAVDLFVRLLGTSLLKPDEYTFAAVISATGAFPATHYGQPLHAQVIKVGLDRSVFIGNTLLSMYLKNGDTRSAQEVFIMIEEKDVILWTEMITWHSRLGSGETAIKLFCKMCHEGHKCDSFVLSGALSACAELATLKQGETIHSLAVKTGCEAEMSTCGSLVDMYAKNGDLQAAELIFSQVPKPDLKCWNSMLGGYGQHGMAGEAMMLFAKILVNGLRPDQVTFLSLLSACSHSGLVEKGKFLWKCMKQNGAITTPRHYSCMVGLLSRAGLLDEAEELLMESTYREEHLELWRTLLSSCVNKRNLTIGVRAAEQALRLDPEDSATHIMLSNLYAAVERWDGVAETRTKIRGLMLGKEPGLSWIEDKNDIHVFSSSDQSNPMIDEARAELHRLEGNVMNMKAPKVPQIRQFF